MIKYIVVWIVLNSFLVPCDFEPLGPDEYGRESSVYVVPAIACYGSTETKMEKWFNSFEEAHEFMVRAQKDCSECSDFKLIKQTEIE